MKITDRLYIFDVHVSFGTYTQNHRKFGWKIQRGAYTVEVVFSNPFDDDHLHDGIADLICVVKYNGMIIGQQTLPNKSDPSILEKLIASLIVEYIDSTKEAEQWAKDNC